MWQNVIIRVERLLGEIGLALNVYNFDEIALL